MGEDLSRGELVQERYRLERALGGGGFGTTWLAEDTTTGQRVALKRLRMDRVDEWKAVELFQREAEVLRGLAHDAIPAYLDAFEVSDASEDLSFFLAQEYIEGRTLEDLVASGDWRPDEGEVRGVLVQVLGILEYLQSRRPPIVHRDLKPSNIIRRPDGRLALIDFGAVKATWDGLGRQSTVAGTFGYMAPEQLRGQATPATDMYGLGATALFLLSGEDPARLPGDGLSIDFRAALTLSPELAGWLDRALAVSPGDRFSDALQARDALLRGPVAASGDEGEVFFGDLGGGEDEAPAIKRLDDTTPSLLDRKLVERQLEPGALPGWTPGGGGWAGMIGMGAMAALAVAAGLAGSLGVGLLVVIGIVWLVCFFMVIGSASPDDANHPLTRMMGHRRELMHGLVTLLPAAPVIAGVYMSHSASAMWTAWGVMIVMALLHWVSWGEWQAMERMQRTEEVTGEVFPMPLASSSYSVPFEVSEHVSGQRLVVQDSGRTGLLGLALWVLHALVWYVGKGLGLLVSGAAAADVAAMPLLSLVLCAVVLGWATLRKPKALIIDRAQDLVKNEATRSQWALSDLSDVSVVHHRGGEDDDKRTIITATTRAGDTVELWRADTEEHEALAEAQVLMLRRLISPIVGEDRRKRRQSRAASDAAQGGEVQLDLASKPRGVKQLKQAAEQEAFWK